MSISRSPSRNRVATSPCTLLRTVPATWERSSESRLSASRLNLTCSSGLPTVRDDFTSTRPGMVSTRRVTSAEAVWRSSRSSPYTSTSIGVRKVKYEGRSNLNRASRDCSSRSRSTSATARSSPLVALGFMRTWIRATFSPSVPVRASDRPAPPTMLEYESIRGFPSSTFWASCTNRSVTSSGVPSGSSTWKENSPCDREGIRSTPRPRAIQRQPRKATSETTSTAPRARSEKRSMAG